MRKFLIIVSLLLTVSVTSQNIYLIQDGKLLITGDERGNHPGTLDLVLGLEFPVIDYKLTSGIQTEYSNLVGGTYKRHSLFLGYNKDDLIFVRLRVSTYINYGIIQRYGVNYGSYGANLELSYPIYKKLRIVLNEQYTERRELKKIYKTKDFHRFSLFAGLKYQL